jgi:HD-GYP domain-containing protein (c-di-GMP phosphodiesterase class II)
MNSKTSVFFLKCNEPREFLEDEKIERLKKIAQITFIDGNNQEQTLLREDELMNLCIRKGSITEVERKKKQAHAAMTIKILKQIPFTKKLQGIPHFAGAHHEFINDKGYHLGQKGNEIPLQRKLMAVTDIVEALTASYRPYKKSMPLSQVYIILRDMARKNELDSDIVELFINENVYEQYRGKYESEL